MKIVIVLEERFPLLTIQGKPFQSLIDMQIANLRNAHELSILSLSDPALPDYETIEGIEYIRFPHDKFKTQFALFIAERAFDVIQIYKPQLPLIHHNLFQKVIPNPLLKVQHPIKADLQ